MASEGVSWWECIKVKKRTGLVYNAEMCLIAALERAVPAAGEIFGLETKIPRKPRNQDEPQVGAVASWWASQQPQLVIQQSGQSLNTLHPSMGCVRFCRHWSAYWSCKLVAPESILGHWVTDWVEDISLYRQRPISGNKFEGSFIC